MKKLILKLLLILPALVFAKQKDICFFSMHPNPSEHFSQIAKTLERSGYEVEIFTSKQFQSKYDKVSFPIHLVDKGAQDNFLILEDESLEEQRAKNLAKRLSKFKVVITDMGYVFVSKVHKSLEVDFPNVKRIVYYDNPEAFVPGEYSRSLGEIIVTNPQMLLFSNANLENQKIQIDNNLVMEGSFERVGLGFYPMQDVETILENKAKVENVRHKLFSKINAQDQKQKILVYFGGANDQYFNEAFPIFLSYVKNAIKSERLKNTCILLQQHPRAQQNGNLDLEAFTSLSQEIEDPTVVFAKSPLSTYEAAAICDKGFYFQTSMVGKFCLANISLAQIAKKPYLDFAIRKNIIPYISNQSSFDAFISGKMNNDNTEKKTTIQESLGYNPSWPEKFRRVISKFLFS